MCTRSRLALPPISCSPMTPCQTASGQEYLYLRREDCQNNVVEVCVHMIVRIDSIVRIGCMRLLGMLRLDHV